MIKALFNNRWFIVCLAVASGLLMVRSIAGPFFDRPDFADAEDPEFYLGETAEEEQGPAVVALQPGQSVLSGQLTWIGDPKRDPFSRGEEPRKPESLEVLPVTATGLLKLPRLDALVAGPDSLLAVLDDRIVRIGDTSGIFRVIRIDRSGVALRAADSDYRLRVADMNTLQPEERTLETSQVGADGFDSTALDVAERSVADDFTHGGDPGLSARKTPEGYR